MPLIETDLLYSFLNANDVNNKFATNAILRVNSGELEVKFSSVSLIELQLIYKSRNIEFEFELDLAELQRIKNVEWALLDPISALTAIHLRKKYNLSFFDSLHVGIAINLDKKIISQDKEYDVISGLKRIPLTTFS